MIVPEGLEVTIFEHCYDGIHKTVRGPAQIAHLDEFSDTISSLKVATAGTEEKKWVVLFSHPNFEG